MIRCLVTNTGPGRSLRVMEVNSGPKNSTNNIFLLRRPRPPKPILDPPSPKVTITTPLETSNDNSTTKSRLPFPGQPTLLRSNMVNNRRHKSLPVHEGLYRTDIEQLIQQHSKLVINSITPRGPEHFPPGRVLRADTLTTMTALDFLPDEIHLIKPDPSFTFKDFQIPCPSSSLPIQISHGVVSRQNYLKLTSWFAKNVPSQESLNTLDLEVNHQAPSSRIPRCQILAGTGENMPGFLHSLAYWCYIQFCTLLPLLSRVASYGEQSSERI